MTATKERKHRVMNDNAEPQFFEGELDTSDYVPDWEAINKSIEKNRAIIASLGDEYRDLLELKRA